MKKIILIILLSLSIKCFAQFASSKAIDSLKSLLALAQEDTTKVNLLNKLSWEYIFVYADSGVNYAKQGMQLAEAIGYTPGKLSSLNHMVIGLTILGNFKEALDYGFKGMQLAESIKDTAEMGWMYVGLLACYRDQEDYKEALVYGYKAKQISGSEHFDPTVRYLCFGVIASVYERSNELDSALYYAKRATALTDNWSGVLETLANIYVKKRQPDTALYYYHKSLTIAERNFVYIDLVDSYNGISKIFESKGQIDSSIYYANKSITQEGARTYPDGVLRSALQLANVYELKGVKDSVIKYQKIAINLKDRLFSREKTREAQSISFNEQLHQQELQQQLAKATLVYKNRLSIYLLIAGLVILTIVAGGLWRRNIYKQKSYTLLQRQKQEIDFQKQKVEKTLEDLKSTQAQLIQFEKMASLGELTTGIAHEIQNPLNFVNNFSDVNRELIDEMKNELANGNGQEAMLIADDIKENEQKINHHGKRADAIVKGMLQHSRKSSGQKEPTDINALAGEYLRLSYHGMRAKDKSFDAKMKTDFDKSLSADEAGIGKINVIPQDIGRVLLNLFNNAFYAASLPSPERIGTGAGGVKEHEPIVSVSTKKSENSVLITVTDNGNGIPPNIVDKIFQPFFTTKPTGEGTGLGLSLSYDIIKAHGGTLKVESKEDEGSEFIITLPIV